MDAVLISKKMFRSKDKATVKIFLEKIFNVFKIALFHKEAKFKKPMNRKNKKK